MSDKAGNYAHVIIKEKYKYQLKQNDLKNTLQP